MRQVKLNRAARKLRNTEKDKWTKQKEDLIRQIEAFKKKYVEDDAAVQVIDCFRKDLESANAHIKAR